MLTFNGLLAAALGFAFWLAAARRISLTDVGLSSAAVAAVAVIAGVGVVGLNSGFLRFIPLAGPTWGTLVVRGYLAAAVASIGLATGLLVAVARLHGGLAPLATTEWAILFAAASATWAIFSLQDVVLIARGRVEIVVFENAAVAVVRIAMLEALPADSGARGVFVAWLVPTVAATILINSALLRDARLATGLQSLLTGKIRCAGVVRYCLGATVGSTATVLVISVMPVVVTGRSGAAANAGFFLPWTIATSLQVIAAGMSAPFALRVARGIADERAELARVLRHATGAIALLGCPLFFALPPLLARLGHSYRVERTLLALLLAATLINAISAVYLARARAKGHVVGAAVTQWAAAIILIGGSAVFLPRFGLTAVGCSAFAAQCVAAVVAISLARWKAGQQTGVLSSYDA